MKKVKRSRLPLASSTPPTNAVVAIPSFRSIWALDTKTAIISSVTTACFSTARIFFSSPSIYSSSALFERRSRTVSKHSCIPSAQSIFRLICFCPILLWILPEHPTIKKDTGSTQSAASAIRQSKKKRLTATSAVETHAPISSGIKWEDAVSMVAQSAMIVLVRSDRSFFPKNDNGILRIFSASVIRRTPLST